MKLFKTMLPPQCKVIRDGQEKTIKAEELVDGDIVRVNGGDKVPADLRLIKVSELKVENSSLTGEPDAIPCTVEKTDDRPTESKNITFNSYVHLVALKPSTTFITTKILLLQFSLH
jgi:sodium/potassium-transporting ATPase subunit alpha